MKLRIIKTVFILVFIICFLGCESPLTREQIILIANTEAKARGLSPQEYGAVYDDSNVTSKGKLGYLGGHSSVVGDRFKSMKGREYQSVIYKPKQRKKGKPTYTFLIDKKNGNVLGVIKKK